MDLKELQAFKGIRHPWELERARVIDRIIQGIIKDPHLSVLDVGGGDGFVALQLRRRHPAARIVAVDSGYGAEVADRLYAGTSITTLANISELGSQQFDLILLLDVLEHVTDDLGLLRTCAGEHLAPSGRMLVFAPAFPSLFGEHDRFLGHVRRYRLPGLRRLAAVTGLHVEQSGYLFLTPLLMRSAAVLCSRLCGISRPGKIQGIGNWTGGRAVGMLVKMIMKGENNLALRLEKAGICIPGLTAWMVCSRS